MKAFRTIPVVLEIVEDMKELCPQAWLRKLCFGTGSGRKSSGYALHWHKVYGRNKLCFGTGSGRKSSGYALHWHKVYGRNGGELTAEIIDKLYGPDA
ncbi:hypothetical protein QW71_03070 [Paenibacillus sp. IHB B 3415]|nr:hypothetical protein QW71_03070 [Paenibacillus sp. IHB B 3415]